MTMGKEDLNLRIELIPIDSLEKYAKNTRKHGLSDVAQIAKSIQKYGFNDPIGIWSDHNVIVEGHGRLEAAKQLGMTEVPCIRLDHLSDEERREYGIMHNRTAELSEWDDAMLKLELEDLDLDIGDLGLDDILGNDDKKSADVSEDVPPDVSQDEPKSKVGDLYKLGRHRLIVGDSTDPNVIARLMDGRQADLCVTDPPYGVDYASFRTPEEAKRKHHRTDMLKIQNDKMSDDDLLQFLTAAFTGLSGVLKPGGAFYIWFPTGYRVKIFVDALHEVGDLMFKQELIWVKSHLVMSFNDYHYQHESCIYGWKDGAPHYFIDDRTQTTLIHEDKPNKSELHPSMKPVGLFARHINNSSRPGESVIDMFGGSGTTMMACEQLGRDCYMCELDPRYADAIITRWETLTGQKAEKIDS